MKFRLIPFFLATLAASIALADGDLSTSMLMNQALDSSVGELTVHGTVPDVMRAVENQSGVRIEASPAVWDDLPWGSDTTLNCHFFNATLRHALDVIARKLGLTYTVGSEAIEFVPSPPLARLGRRATLDELRVLDFLAARPFNPLGADSETTVRDVLETVDRQLRFSASPFVTQDQAFDEFALQKPVQIPRNASLMEALEDMSRQTNATWYPWGRSLVIVKKVDSVRLLLGKRIDREYQNTDLAQVLMDLSEYSGVSFNYAPGVLQQVPEQYRKVTLKLQDATVDQTLAILSGATGLKFTPSDQGIDVTYAAPR
ncbi:MAG TPA: hypothetical protein VL992_17070 [Tepidisphaeraceae bacterium]|nr:hypothetical protein [Tepidisphaeraceae bacterium]